MIGSHEKWLALRTRRLVDIIESAIITDSNTSGVKKIDFSNCENPYIIFIKNSVQMSALYACVWDETKTNYTDYQGYLCSNIKSVYVRLFDNYYTPSSPYRVYNFTLPTKVAGNYWITDNDYLGNVRNLINVEEENGQWKIVDETLCVSLNL